MYTDAQLDSNSVEFYQRKPKYWKGWVCQWYGRQSLCAEYAFNYYGFGATYARGECTAD